MLDPDSLVGGDALAQFALILAVPVRAHRNREFRLRPVAAQAFEDRRVPCQSLPPNGALVRPSSERGP